MAKPKDESEEELNEGAPAGITGAGAEATEEAGGGGGGEGEGAGSTLVESTASSTAAATAISSQIGTDETTQDPAHEPVEGLTDLWPTYAETTTDRDSGLGTSSRNQESSLSSFPVPASDHYTGPPEQSSDSPLLPLTETCCRAKRLTSLGESNGLDSLSAVTVRGTLAQLSLTPRNGEDLAGHGKIDSELPNVYAVKSKDVNVSSAGKDIDDYEKDDTASEKDDDAEVDDVLSKKTPDGKDEAGSKQTDEDDMSLGDLEFLLDDQPTSLMEENFAENEESMAKDKGKDNKSDDCKSVQSPVQTPVESPAQPRRNPRQLGLAEINRCRVYGGRGDPKHPRFVLRATRLATFPTPTRLCGVQVDREDLAHNGFFFQEASGVQSITCFQCGAGLRYWEAGMTPAEEHAVLSPRCPAVQL